MEEGQHLHRILSELTSFGYALTSSSMSSHSVHESPLPYRTRPPSHAHISPSSAHFRISGRHWQTLTLCGAGSVPNASFVHMIDSSMSRQSVHESPSP